MATNDKPKVVMMGAGLGGAVMACYFARAGYAVDVYERRGDLRSGKIDGGRSINLALSLRGIHALEEIGVADEVMKVAIPMRGRMIHSPTGDLTYQPYGTDESQAINSVSRSGLNMVLLDAAERNDDVRIHFHHICEGVDLGSARGWVQNTETGDRLEVQGDVLVGADGAFSVVRGEMQKLDRFDCSQDYLAHGYKEMTIPAGPNGEFALEKNALHIWPRRSFMMIALPNRDGSFTCTLFWPFEGPNSFAALRSDARIRAFFERQFPDAVPLMPTLVDDFQNNPTSSLVTVRCCPWNAGGKVVLLGDACHAVVPFYGQGMNAAFEDCTVLNECIGRHANDRARAFAEYMALRKKNVDALADLAIGNFVEMRDRTGSRLFLLRKKTEKVLHRWFPKWYVPLYSMATFSRIPYVEAVERAGRQDRVVVAVAVSIVLILIVIALQLIF